MGKHIKTQMDYNMINDLAEELSKVDPENKVLARYLEMQNFEGAELRKLVNGFPWADKIPAVNGK
tara:strand:+ start:194 stop:388 length:195 start_codon:yes stop_codon:yes gene_type:complete